MCSLYLELGAFRDNIIGLVLAPASDQPLLLLLLEMLGCPVTVYIATSSQQRPAPGAVLIHFMTDIKDRQIFNNIISP